jgi:hypothetical protein
MVARRRLFSSSMTCFSSSIEGGCGRVVVDDVADGWDREGRAAEGAWTVSERRCLNFEGRTRFLGAGNPVKEAEGVFGAGGVGVVGVRSLISPSKSITGPARGSPSRKDGSLSPSSSSSDKSITNRSPRTAIGVSQVARGILKSDSGGARTGASAGEMEDQ